MSFSTNDQIEYFEVSQVIALQDPQGQVLILKAPSGCWMLPGGRINRGETWEAGLRREVEEESGITQFQIHGVLGVDNYLSTTGRQKYKVYFAGQTEQTSVRLSHEHVDFAWITADTDLATFKFGHRSVQDIIRLFFAMKMPRK